MERGIAPAAAFCDHTGCDHSGRIRPEPGPFDIAAPDHAILTDAKLKIG